MNNNRRSLYFVIVMLAAISFVSVSAFAEEEAAEKGGGFSAGPGVAIIDRPYKGYGTDTRAFPFLTYRSESFYLLGPRFGYKVFSEGNFSFDAIANWRFDGYDEDDSRHLDGMDDRDMTMELGVALSYADGFGVTKLSFLNDIFGKHDGHSVELSYQKMFRKDKFAFTPSAGLSWHNDNFVDYYYGVRSKEATAEREAYDASDALNPFLSVQLNYQMAEQWSLFTRLKYEFLDNEISDSPIVGQHDQTLWVLGLIYKF